MSTEASTRKGNAQGQPGILETIYLDQADDIIFDGEDDETDDEHGRGTSLGDILTAEAADTIYLGQGDDSDMDKSTQGQLDNNFANFSYSRKLCLPL